MPTVPRVNQVGNIKPAPVPTIRIPGTEILPAIQAAGDQVIKISDQQREKERQEAAELAALRSSAAAASAADLLLRDPKLGDDGQPRGALYQKGIKAMPQVDIVKEKYVAELDKIREGLTTEEQRQAFDKVGVARLADLTRTLEQHAGQQGEVLRKTTMAANLSNFINDAVQNPSDTGKVEQAVKNVKELMALKAKWEGVPAAASVYQREALTELYGGVINRFLAEGRPEAATRFFASHRKDFGEKADEMERAVNDAMEKFLGPDAAFSTAFGNLQNSARQTAASNPMLLGKLSLEETDAALVGRMSDLQRRSLAETRQLLQTGQQPTTDPQVHTALNELVALAQTDPAAAKRFKDLDLNLYWPKLSPTDMAKFTKIQDDARASKKNGEAAQIQMNQTILAENLAQMGIRVGAGASPKTKAEAAHYKYAVEKRLNDEYLLTGKKPTFEDNRRVAAEMMKEVVVGKGFFGGEKTRRTYQLEPGQVKQPDATVPPGNEFSIMLTEPPRAASQLGPTPAQRKDLAFELASRGYAVTEGNIQQLYQRKKAKGAY